VRLAIIGSGISGMSANFYARKLFEESEIIVFEKEDRVGGRVHTKMIKGIADEIGGTFFHPINKYLIEMIQSSGLTRNSFTLTSSVWNGEKFVFIGSRNSELIKGFENIRL
jgi:protoporphyrinogen oxidase